MFEYSTSFERWQQVGDIIPGSRVEENFGRRVAVSPNGKIVAGSGFQSALLPGVVRVYSYNPGNDKWEQRGQDLSGGDKFGQSLSLNSDGSILAVGADRYQDDFDESQVVVYRFNTAAGVWQQMGQTLDGEFPNDSIGWSVELSVDGTILATGAQEYDNDNGSNAGRVYVWKFDQTSGFWEPKGSVLDGILAGGRFGFQVSLSSDGSTVASAAAYGASPGNVRVFEYKA